MEFSISALISSFFFFLSGASVNDKNIDRAFYQEQLLQLNPEVHLMLSGEQRYCNCNFQGLKLKLHEKVKLSEMKYYPDTCKGESFPLISGKSWKGIPITEISLGDLKKFTDGYLANLRIEFQGPKSSPESFRKVFPVMLDGEMVSDTLTIDCKPLVSAVLPDRTGFSVLLNGSMMKYQGQEDEASEVIGDAPDEVGSNLPSYRFSTKQVLHSFYAGPSRDGEIYCVQLKNLSMECANPKSGYMPFGPKSYPLKGVGRKEVTELVLNHTTVPGIFTGKGAPIFPPEKTGSFATPDQIGGTYSGPPLDLADINSSPIGEYINRENTFLALYDDGQLAVLSFDDNKHFDIFLPGDLRAKKILTYNFDSACFLSREDEVYCWGFTAGFYTDGNVSSDLLTTKGPSEKSKNSLFGQPVKIPVTKTLADKIKKLKLQGAKIKTIKAFYFSEKALSSPGICAILTDGKFICFPRPLDEKGNTWGQMTDFPVLSQKINAGKVTNFWPWKEASSGGDERDPLPIVLVDDQRLVFAINKNYLKSYDVTGIDPTGVRDVVADGAVVNVLFQDGKVVGLNPHPPKSAPLLDSAITEKDFDLSTTSEEARTVFDFGGPVQKIFINSSSPITNGTLCAWLFNGSIKCSGTRWGYGDGIPRLISDPDLKGDKFPRVKL